MAGMVRAQNAVLSIGVAALGCWGVGLVSQLLTAPSMLVPPVWPTAGVAFCLLALGGSRLWPGVFVGALLANCWAVFQLDHSLSPKLLTYVLICSLASVIQALLAVAMSRSMDSTEKLAVIFRYLILVGPICCILTASVSVTAQHLLGLTITAPLWQVWCAEWLGDCLGVLILAPLVPAWYLGEPKLRAHRLSFLMVPMIAVLALLLYFSLLVRRDEAQRITALFQRESEAITGNLDQQLTQVGQVLDYVAVLVGSSGELDPELFQNMARCGLSNNESLAFLGWAQKPQNSAMEFSNLFQQITYLEPGGVNGRIASINAISDPVPKMALEQICRRGNLHGVLLSADRSQGQQSGSLLLVLPVYTSAGGSRIRCEQLAGYLVSQVDLALLTRKLTGSSVHGFSLSANKSWAFQVRYGDSERDESEPDYRRALNFAGLDLELDFAMSRSHRVKYASWAPWALLLAGHLFVGLLGAFLLWHLGHTHNFEAAVNGRTVELARMILTLEREIEYHTRSQEEGARVWETEQRAVRNKDRSPADRNHEVPTQMDSFPGRSRQLLTTRLAEGQDDCAENVQVSAATLHASSGDLLDLSLVEVEGAGLEKAPFHLPSLIREAAEIPDFAARLHVKITFLPNVPKYLRGDQNKLRQILQDLIQNGTKFRKEGCIGISCHLIGRSGDAFHLRIQVHSGLNQEPEGRKNLLGVLPETEEPAPQELRLPCLEVVLELLPIQEQHVASSAMRLKQEGSHEGPRRILIVENNSTDQKEIQTLLEGRNYALTMASNGHEAMNITQKQTFELILMECHMPGMDGYEATAAIRIRDGNRTPIIAMTARILAGDREKCLAVGMNDYLSKPLNPDKLREKIRYWLA